MVMYCAHHSVITTYLILTCFASNTTHSWCCIRQDSAISFVIIKGLLSSFAPYGVKQSIDGLAGMLGALTNESVLLYGSVEVIPKATCNGND